MVAAPMRPNAPTPPEPVHDGIQMRVRLRNGREQVWTRRGGSWECPDCHFPPPGYHPWSDVVDARPAGGPA